MSEGLPSCRTTSYTRARSARDLRSNTRPGADQLRCNGSSTTARARATSSRGSRSGAHVGLPRAEGRWVNDTCGSAASSHPALDRSRAKVATVGDFRPCSYADSVGREVPARRASSSWVRPELARTCSSSSAAFIIHLVYPIRYRIRSDTIRTGTHGPRVHWSRPMNADVCSIFARAACVMTLPRADGRTATPTSPASTRQSFALAACRLNWRLRTGMGTREHTRLLGSARGSAGWAFRDRLAIMTTTQPSPWPPETDALLAAPASHRLLLENDQVRVLDVALEPED